jgi:gluconolactonase
MVWEARVVARGLRFPEGPVFLGSGEVAVTEIRGQALTACAGGATTVLAHTGGGPNGAARGADGCFYVANNGGLSLGPGGYWHAPEPIPGRIQRVTQDGGVEDWCAELSGPAPHRPNDLCFGPDGMLYFTDPRNWEDFSSLGPGWVWRTGGEGPAELLAEVPGFPNGIAFGPDGRSLYVAQTLERKILAFPWTPAGLGESRGFCHLPRGFPDGFCFTAGGDLYVCGSMGDVVCVFDSDGTLKETIDAPEDSEPTNCCIGDGVLYLTMSGTGELAAIDVGVDALPLYG